MNVSETCEEFNGFCDICPNISACDPKSDAISRGFGRNFRPVIAHPDAQKWANFPAFSSGIKAR